MVIFGFKMIFGDTNIYVSYVLLLHIGLVYNSLLQSIRVQKKSENHEFKIKNVDPTAKKNDTLIKGKDYAASIMGGT